MPHKFQLQVTCRKDKTAGKYLFFGNGIMLKNIDSHYERLKSTFEAEKQKKLQQAQSRNILNALFGWISPPKQLPQRPASLNPAAEPQKLPESPAREKPEAH